MNNRCIYPCFGTIHLYHAGFSMLSTSHTLLTVHIVNNAFSPFREKILVWKSDAHSSIYNCQLTIIIQLDSLIIYIHKYKVISLFIIIKTDSDRSHKKWINLYIVLHEFNISHNFWTPECNSFFRKFKKLSKTFHKASDFSTATYYKDRTDWLSTVKFYNLTSNALCNWLHSIFHHIRYLIRWNLIWQSHYIVKFNFFLLGTLAFKGICLIKIRQIMFCKALRYLIAGTWNHAICNNASILCNGNIGCSCSYIDKCDI